MTLCKSDLKRARRVLGETGQRAPNHLVPIDNTKKEYNLGDDTKTMPTRGIRGSKSGVQVAINT